MNPVQASQGQSQQPALSIPSRPISETTAPDVQTKVTPADITARALMHKDKNQLSIAEEAFVRELEKANKALAGVNKRFEYNVHSKTGEIMVKVIDKDTNEVIREIPPEKILDLVAKLQEIVGMIIDEKR